MTTQVEAGMAKDADFLLQAERGVANGVASLDGSGLIPVSEIPDGVNGLNYIGSWNATTNTPTLASGVGTQGDYHVVGTAGSTSIDGISDWVATDWIAFNGTIWQKIDNTDKVASVHGRSGVVVAVAEDYDADEIKNIPAGTIVATNVQAALAELDAEKALLVHTHTLAQITDEGNLAALNTVNTAQIDDEAVTLAKMAHMATASFLARDTADPGDVEVLDKAAALAILNVADGANAYSHPNHTGDVTSTGDGATVIAAAAVTNAKRATLAEARFRGRKAGGGAGDTQDMTGAEALAILGVEAAADVTDASNVDAAGAVMEADFNAHTVLMAVADNVPAALTVGASTIVGRKSTGDIVALTGAELLTILGVETAATADQTDSEIETAYDAQVAAASQSEAEAGSETAIRRFSPARIKEAILALETGGGGGGKVLQVVDSRTGAMSTGSTSMPIDDTIPQITEGDEYLTVAITPAATDNNLVIMINVQMSNSAENRTSLALFQDTTANALAVGRLYINAGNATTLNQMTLIHYMAAGTTSSTTFRVRIGRDSNGTITFNGSSGDRKDGGVLSSSITVMEID